MTVSPSVSALPSIARLLARGTDPAHIIAALHQAALDLYRRHRLRAPPPRPDHRAMERGLRRRSRDVDAGPWLSTARGAEAAGTALSCDRPLVLRVARRPTCRNWPTCCARRLACWCRWWAPSSLWACWCWRCRRDARRTWSWPRCSATRWSSRWIAHAPPTNWHCTAKTRDLMESFARGGATWLTLMPALEAMCRGVARLMAADVVEVWHHDRRARALVLTATSNPHRRQSTPPVPTTDLARPAGRLAAPRPPGAGDRRRRRRAGDQCGPGRAAARQAPRAGGAGGARRAPRTGRRDGVARSRHRDQPAAVGDPRERAVARRRDPIADRTGQRLQLAHRPGGRHRRRRTSGRGQSCLCGACGTDAGHARRPAAK